MKSNLALIYFIFQSFLFFLHLQELWYRYQCPECPATTIAHPTGNTFTAQRLELTALKSGFTYTVLIFAENKVSKMESVISQYALVEFTTRLVVSSFTHKFI